MGIKKLYKTGQKVVKNVKKIKVVARKLKQEGKAAVQVAKHGARTFGKLPLYKKAALLAAAPLAPLAYGASHGFRKPKKVAKLVKSLGVGAAKQVIGVAGAVANFHQDSIRQDWAKAKQAAGVKPAKK